MIPASGANPPLPGGNGTYGVQTRNLSISITQWFRCWQKVPGAVTGLEGSCSQE